MILAQHWWCIKITLPKKPILMILGPKNVFTCLISWEKERKQGTHMHLVGGISESKGGFKRAILGPTRSLAIVSPRRTPGKSREKLGKSFPESRSAFILNPGKANLPRNLGRLCPAPCPHLLCGVVFRNRPC